MLGVALCHPALEGAGDALLGGAGDGARGHEAAVHEAARRVGVVGVDGAVEDARAGPVVPAHGEGVGALGHVVLVEVGPAADDDGVLPGRLLGVGDGRDGGMAVDVLVDLGEEAVEEEGAEDAAVAGGGGALEGEEGGLVDEVLHVAVAVADAGEVKGLAPGAQAGGHGGQFPLACLLAFFLLI